MRDHPAPFCLGTYNGFFNIDNNNFLDNNEYFKVLNSKIIHKEFTNYYRILLYGINVDGKSLDYDFSHTWQQVSIF